MVRTGRRTGVGLCMEMDALSPGLVTEWGLLHGYPVHTCSKNGNAITKATRTCQLFRRGMAAMRTARAQGSKGVGLGWAACCAPAFHVHPAISRKRYYLGVPQARVQGTEEPDCAPSLTPTRILVHTHKVALHLPLKKVWSHKPTQARGPPSSHSPPSTRETEDKSQGSQGPESMDPCLRACC